MTRAVTTTGCNAPHIGRRSGSLSFPEADIDFVAVTLDSVASRPAARKLPRLAAAGDCCAPKAEPLPWIMVAERWAQQNELFQGKRIGGQPTLRPSILH